MVGDCPPPGDLPHTVGRWWKAGVQPNQHHMKALLALADDFGLSCLFTDDRGNQETRTSAVTVAVAAIPNSAATGAPTISGTAQVGQMLNASTSNISDSDGLANATFTYQWIANDGTEDTDIQDATGSTYILAAADEGKTIKVRVRFTDDRGNQETRTSAVTVAVAAIPNSAATGAPTISGTAQVGQMLNASTSNISDSDGLANATFTTSGWPTTRTSLTRPARPTHWRPQTREGPSRFGCPSLTTAVTRRR